ncbi:hypothetical protein [Urbifossiella limnaea]|uniref:Uncharacterized protein n=1 Tax=Urbifossiella limnaea TaxID=2528023 RepID=A0A517Y2V7_9BACT|nr:hypothetical protein [Urbifossiella limnaea]QDU24143.1 hypothetical protein ETAA1_61570 [Urbifossiella limnaea]
MSTPQPTPPPSPEGRSRFAALAQVAAATAACALALVYHSVILTLTILDGRHGTAAPGRVHPGNL